MSVHYITVGFGGADVPSKLRPKVTRNGTFTPKKTVEAEARIRDAWTAKYGLKFADFTGAFRLCVKVFRKLPKSKPKRIVSEPDTTRPDIDNYCKLVMDALNGVAWHDDSQCVELVGKKTDRMRMVIQEAPYMEIWVEYFKEEQC